MAQRLDKPAFDLEKPCAIAVSPPALTTFDRFRHADTSALILPTAKIPVHRPAPPRAGAGGRRRFTSMGHLRAILSRCCRRLVQGRLAGHRAATSLKVRSP